MRHVIDDLELYALGALPSERHEAVGEHLAACAPCRTAAADIAEVVALLPDAVPQREPPASLRTRILAAATADAPARTRRARATRIPRVPRWPRLGLIAAGLGLLLVLGGSEVRLRAVEATSREYEAMAGNFAHGGRTWYMAGIDRWAGMGGNLMQPASGGPAFVAFHDLRGLPDGERYTLWLIDREGKWVRGSSFRPSGRELQLVTVGQDLAGYERCAVTVETSAAGKPQGPLVMQSRIAPPRP